MSLAVLHVAKKIQLLKFCTLVSDSSIRVLVYRRVDHTTVCDKSLPPVWLKHMIAYVIQQPEMCSEINKPRQSVWMVKSPISTVSTTFQKQIMPFQPCLSQQTRS